MEKLVMWTLRWRLDWQKTLNALTMSMYSFKYFARILWEFGSISSQLILIKIIGGGGGGGEKKKKKKKIKTKKNIFFYSEK